MWKKMKLLFSAGLITLFALSVFTGCGQETQKVSEKSVPDQITIGVQVIPNDEQVVREQYEKELGTKVVFKQFDSGRDVNTAMASGQIDIAIMGSAPAAIGIAKGIPYEVFWIHDVEGENESLAVKNAANVKDIKGLEGKTVAVPVGSTAQYSLLNALKQAGVDIAKVKILDMQPPEIFAAWQRGDIDAAYVWQPTLGKLLTDGKILVTGRELAKKGIVTADVGVVSKSFAEKYPDIVKKYVQLQIRGYKLFQDKPEEAAGHVAQSLNLEPAEALKEMKELVWLSVDEQLSADYLGTSGQKGAFTKTLKDTADFLVEQKALDQAPGQEAFTDGVNPSFAEAARNQ